MYVCNLTARQQFLALAMDHIVDDHGPPPILTKPLTVVAAMVVSCVARGTRRCDSNGVRPAHYEQELAIQYLWSSAKSQNAAIQMESKELEGCGNGP